MANRSLIQYLSIRVALEYKQRDYGEAAVWQEEASRQERDTATLSLSPGGLGHPKSYRGPPDP